MIPLIDKNTVKTITYNITPDEVEYVAGISNIIDDVKKNEDICDDNCDDVIFVAKIMAFTEKFHNLHWAARSMSYHTALDEFYEILSVYSDEIAENIQSVIGQFHGNQFTKLELPINDNPLEVINELKICVTNWFECHKDDMEYEGCRNITSGLLENIHKYVYLFRLCKINEA